MSTTTQLRGICPVCAAEHATKKGHMVQHGYTRPQGWHQNVGDCYGTGKPHFGTPEGRRVTSEVEEMCRASAVYQRTLAARIRAGELPCYDNTRERNVIASPTDRDREREASHHDSQARMLDADAKSLSHRYDNWAPRALKKVAVDNAPKVHLNSPRGRPECAGPYFSNYNVSTTDDRSKVTCSRCINAFKYVDARAAARSKQP